MKIYHLVSILALYFGLGGCATEQPAKDPSGAILKPEDFPVVSTPASNDGGEKPPKLIRAVNPVYPIEDRKKGIGGTVVVKFIVDENGKVTSAEAIQAPDAALAKAAVDAILQWEFIPAEKYGMKVNVRMTQSLTFSLR